MYKIISTFIILFIFQSLNANDNPLWLRSSVISPDGKNIVFTYKGDLYKVSSEGGSATQLTFHQAHDHEAVWSKDGSKIAFSSDRYGNFDIYIMSSEGGMAERLTYHSNNESPYAFSNDGMKIYFGAIRQDAVDH